MKYLWTVVLCLFVTTGYAQEPAVALPPPAQETNYSTLYADFDAAIADIRKNEPHSLHYRYFTAYNLPKNLQDDAGKALSFVVHTLSSQVAVKQPAKITDTLWRVDIRDYGWTTQAIENVSKVHPYFASDFLPTKEYQDKYGYMLQASGNSLFRLDWFVVVTTDTTRQLDIGQKILPYYELLYGKDKIPETIDDFRKFWDVSIDFTKPDPLLKASVINEGDSRVSNHTRMAARKRTPTGYLWETWDHPDNDYVERLEMQSSARKAGEAIVSNFVGMQAYFLFNGENGKRVDFADNTFVRDREHPTGRGNRVITPVSCMICHDTGINAVTNEVREILKKNVGLYAAKDYDYSLYLENFYLNNLDKLIKDDQRDFTDALLLVNGLTPEENLTLYKKFIVFYDNAITLEQAAIETGVAVEVFKEKLEKSTSGRLAGLTEGRKIPRSIWDRIGPQGKFGQAMILIHNIRKDEYIAANAPIIAYQIEKQPTSPVEKPAELPKVEPAKTELPKAPEQPDTKWLSYEPLDGWITLNKDLKKVLVIDEKKKEIGNIQEGEWLKPAPERNNDYYYGVYYGSNSKVGWVKRTEVEVFKPEQ
jgi:hypothetical protein